MLRELGSWATRSPLHDPMLPLSAASIMMSFRTMYSRERANGVAVKIGFRFGAEGFVVDFNSNGVHIRRDEPEGCVLVVETNPMSLASVVYGGRPVRDAEASGELALTGSRALFGRFVTWFPLRKDRVIVENAAIEVDPGENGLRAVSRLRCNRHTPASSICMWPTDLHAWGTQAITCRRAIWPNYAWAGTAKWPADLDLQS